MKNKIMVLFRYASIVMSLLSWYTTYQGFQNTVFARDKHSVLTAMLASLAIQTALLAGVLKYFPIIGTIRQNYQREKQKKGNKAGIKYFMEGFVITAILLFALATSITFSYISVVNNMYANDFAVNANIEMEQFMRTAVTEMESDNEEYLKLLRLHIVQQLEENGETIINESVRDRAGKYANTVGKLTEAGRQKTLVDLQNDKGVKKKKVGKFTIREVTLDYVKRDYQKMLKKNPELLQSRFLERMRRKINDLNNSYYIDYCLYYEQYSNALKKYNQWLKRIKKGKMTSLEEMKGLKDNSSKIKQGIEALIERIQHFPTGGYAKNSTKELKAAAKSNVSALLTAVEDLENSVEAFINNSYGKDSLAFAEIISAFGSKSTKIEELERARDQMLEMQGIMLQGERKEGQTGMKVDLREVTNLMENLEHYVIAVEYNSKIQGLKESVKVNYNIINNIQEEQIEEKTKESFHEESWKDHFLLTSSAISTGSISDSSNHTIIEKEALDTKNQEEVITVTSEEWTDIKKIQMSEFTGLIFDHPVNLYCIGVKEGRIEEALEKKETIDDNQIDSQEDDSQVRTYQEKYQEIEILAYEYRKSFLDTSDSEKAYNLLFRRQYFPYFGKACLSAAFAIFLDVGAFAIGFLMYRMGKENSEKQDNKKQNKSKKVKETSISVLQQKADIKDQKRNVLFKKKGF